MHRKKWIIRAVAILLAALMLVSVVVVAIQVFSLEPGAEMDFVNTGDDDEPKLLFYVAGGAVALFLIVGVMPRLFKKKK